MVTKFSNVGLASVFLTLLGPSEATIISSTLANNKGAAEIWTCDTPISYYAWDYTPLMLGPYSYYYDAICGYPPAIGTLLNCAIDLANDHSDAYQEKIFKYAAQACGKYSSYHEDWTFYRDQYSNSTNYLKPIEEIGNTSIPFYNPTVPELDLIKPEYIGYSAYYFNLDSGTWFSVGICGYFLLLIIISAIYNFLRQTSLARSLNNSTFSKAIQKYIIFPTLLPNGKFSQSVGWKFCSVLFPNRIQFIADLFLFALQVAFYCVSYRYKEGWWFGTPEYAWQRYLADRTGIMAFGKIPLLVLFAGRNNFLLWITGWSYSTFLHFHKVVACWMSLDTLIHSVAYTLNSKGYYTLYLKDTYFACGVAATVFCGLILGQAFHPLRVFYYEYFLTIHIVFAICFIIMCWYHCKELGWLEWLIAACCAWFFDRILRVIRMFSFGWRTATISVAGENLMKVEVSKPAWWFHKPGTFAYIYFAGWIFWESHPFTTVVEGNNLCAYIRVKKGVTYRVWNKLIANGNTMLWKVSMEGPYGGGLSTPLKKYDEALLIAGGSGAPSILENAGNVLTGKMVWISPTLLNIKAYKPLLEKINTELEIYITKEQGLKKNCSLQQLFGNDSSSENLSSDSGKETDSEKALVITSNSSITINYGRPNIAEIINSSVAKSHSNSIGIMACGPPVLMDDIRNVISSNVTTWDKSVDFFDEFQIW